MRHTCSIEAADSLELLKGGSSASASSSSAAFGETEAPPTKLRPSSTAPRQEVLEYAYPPTDDGLGVASDCISARAHVTFLAVLGLAGNSESAQVSTIL
jgi:hypothetical protein